MLIYFESVFYVYLYVFVGMCIYGHTEEFLYAFLYKPHMLKYTDVYHIATWAYLCKSTKTKNGGT